MQGKINTWGFDAKQKKNKKYNKFYPKKIT